jgi:serine/threonine-protein kinase
VGERSRICRDNNVWIHLVPDPRLEPAADRLDSWKDIASYLRRDVSTVQRWEKREGLPVHRHLHDKQGSVYAFKSELDTWWDQGKRSADPHSAPVAAGAGRRGWPRAAALWFAAAATIGVAAWLTAGRDAPAPEVIRSAIPTPREAVNALPIISPDGTQLVYNTVSQSGFSGPLYIKAVHELAGRPIPETATPLPPFFSPDGNWIGYFSRGTLYKVATRGGDSLALAPAPNARGGAWLDDDTIVFAADHMTGLSRVPAIGGTATVISSPDRRKRERTHRYPFAVPGTRAVLFVVHHASGDSFDDADIEALRLDTGERTLVLRGGSNPIVAASGHLLFARRGQIWAAPFDVEKLRLTGPAMPVVDGVAHERGTGRMAMTLSAGGTLVYAPGGSFSDRQLVWADRAGRLTPALVQRGSYQLPRISPDGRFIVVGIDDGVARVWLLDIVRGVLTRRTTGWDAEVPFWSPDGDSIVMSQGIIGAVETQFDLLSMPRDASEDAAAVILPQAFGFDWSSDGSRIVVGQERGALSILSLRPRSVTRVVEPRENGQNPRLSPDGRWLAYSSPTAGRSEVFVAQLDASRRRFQISSAGGVFPVWSRDGRELYFRQPEPPLVMVVTIDAQPPFSASRPQTLFEAPPGTTAELSFDVAPDGRFLFVSGPQETWRATGMVMVQNWFEELRRKVPIR